MEKLIVLDSDTYHLVKGIDEADHAGICAPMLTASHFAFMRAVFQGIDPHTCWRRYLATCDAPGTTQDIRRTIDRVKNAFAVASKQHQRPGTARLMRLAVAEQHVPALALADFVAASALDGFSEAEQFTLYEQQFGAQGRKHARLVARQLEALNWLQRVMPDVDVQQEMIADWLERRLADRLAAVGLVRTADLSNLMRRRADRWWCGIAYIGAIKAARVVASMPLQQGQESERLTRARSEDGHRLGSDQQGVYNGGATAGSACIAAWTEVRPSAVLIAPLRSQSQIMLSDSLESRGQAPPPQCRIAATNDLEAVRCWLQVGVGQRCTSIGQPKAVPLKSGRAPIAAAPAAAKPPDGLTVRIDARLPVPGWDLLDHLSTTQRAYWKEAERFLLWLMIERCTTLSALTQQDCSAYEAFARAPGGRWCGPRGRGKHNPLWRPFEGPLHPPAQAYAVGVLSRLCRFLVDCGYLASSPWEYAGQAHRAALVEKSHCFPRSLEIAAWLVIEHVQRQLAPTSANIRLQVAIQLMRSSGARLGDLVRASVDDLEAPRKPRRAWLLHLHRANGSMRSACLHPDAVRLLQRYFIDRGLDGVLQAPANYGAKLLGKATDALQRAPWAPCAKGPIDPRGGIGLGTMADQLRAFFQLCAHACAGNPALATCFLQANSHWLRGGPTARRALRRQAAAA